MNPFLLFYLMYLAHELSKNKEDDDEEPWTPKYLTKEEIDEINRKVNRETAIIVIGSLIFWALVVVACWHIAKYI